MTAVAFPPVLGGGKQLRQPQRGRRFIQIGGSETARGLTVDFAGAGNITFDAVNKLISVHTAAPHEMHDGANVLLACEGAIAPFLNGGVATVDNMFSYGPITVVGVQDFTMPYWSAMAGTIYYDTGAVLSGVNTQVFSVMRQEILSPDNKFWECQRWLGFPHTLLMDLATGSNNTMNLTERIPALVAMAKARQFDHLIGTLGVGNTLLYGANHSWTPAMLVAQITSDVLKFANALAPYGIQIEIELPTAQGNSTGFSVAGTLQVMEALRKLAADPELRISLLDDFSNTYDATTGLLRNRYQRNGTDNVHPSAEACQYEGLTHADMRRFDGVPAYLTTARSALDNLKSDAASLQLMDPMLAGTTTVAASGLDAKCTGLVPELVTNIATTGNAARAIAFSYVKGQDGLYYVLARITAGAAGDTFSIVFSNPAGARALATLLSTMAGRVVRPEVGVFAFTPKTGSWTSIDSLFATTLSYRTISNRNGIHAADSYNNSAYTDGPMTGPRVGPIRMKDVTLPALTACTGAAMKFVATAASAGTADLLIGKLTLRDVT